MKTLLTNILNTITRRHSLEQIVANLSGPLSHLESLMERHSATINDNRDEIMRLAEHNSQLMREQDRAKKVHFNLRELLAIG